MVNRTNKQITVNDTLRKSDIEVIKTGEHSVCNYWSLEAPGRPRKLLGVYPTDTMTNIYVVVLA